MLLFKDVAFNYPNQQVFSELNLQVDQSEFVFLIGASGSGKTTLMQLVYMNLKPQSGYVRIGDYTSDKIKSKDLPFLRRKIGIVFQDFKLLKDRNVYDNLAFVLAVTGTPRSQMKRKIFHALSEVGLSHKQKNMPHQLSGGEQQRIAIARAMLNDPSIILADEPTGNLDPDTSKEILDNLKKINERGTSVIFATHNYELVKQTNNRIIKLVEGKAIKVVFKKKTT